MGSYVAEAQQVVARQVELPAGYSLAWSGQYEYMVRAKERLSVVGPLTLAIIMLLLYLNFGRFAEVAIIMEVHDSINPWLDASSIKFFLYMQCKDRKNQFRIFLNSTGNRKRFTTQPSPVESSNVESRNVGSQNVGSGL